MKNSLTKITLGDVASLSYGKMPDKHKLGSGDSVVFSGYKYLDKYPEANCKKGDVIVVARGVGGTGDVKIVKRDCYLTNLSIKIDFNKDSKINPEFFYYMHKANNLRHLDSGSAQSQITITDLKRYVFSAPPIGTQNNIVKQIRSIDEFILINNQRIQILEKIAQRLYEEWFVDFKFPGHEKVKMVDSKIGKIPEGWKISNLGKVAELNNKSTKGTRENDIIRYIDIRSVSTGSVDTITNVEYKNAPSRARRLVSHGNIIVATVRPNRRSFALILEPKLRTVASTGFAVISPMIPFSYCYLFLSQQSYTDYLTNNAKGSTYPAVSIDDFKKSKILIPNAELLNEFHLKVEPTLRLKNNLLAKNKILKETRDLLLPRLISGEIES